MYFDAIACRPSSSQGGHRRVMAGLLAGLVVLLLTACNTTPEKPPPAPEPLPEAAPPLTPPPLPDSGEAPPPVDGQAEDAAGGGGSGAPGMAGNFPPPRNDAAEVEMEEVPVGENGQPAPRPRTEVLAEIQDSQAGGGGAAMPTGGRRGDGSAAEVPTTGQAMVSGSVAGPSMAAPAVQVGGTAQTVAEQRAALDGELAAKLETFDAQMRRAAASGNAAATTGGGGSEQGVGGGQGQRRDQAAAGAGGAAATGSGLGNTPDLVGTGSGQVQPSPLLAGTPPDVGDGADDDVLARQLREAAQKEKDPLLREKLWAEYRKYKAGR